MLTFELAFELTETQTRAPGRPGRFRKRSQGGRLLGNEAGSCPPTPGGAVLLPPLAPQPGCRAAAGVHPMASDIGLVSSSHACIYLIIMLTSRPVPV